MSYQQDMYELEKKLLKEIEQEKKLSLRKISRMIALSNMQRDH